MKKIYILAVLLISSYLYAGETYVGAGLSFVTGIPFHANGEAGLIIRSKVTDYFYIYNIINVGYAMNYGDFYDGNKREAHGFIISHAFYPAFRFGKKNLYFIFTPPSPVLKVIPLMSYYARIENDFIVQENSGLHMFPYFFFGISNRFAIEIELNQNVIFSPFAVNLDLMINIIAAFLDIERMDRARFSSSVESYFLIRMNKK